MRIKVLDLGRPLIAIVWAQLLVATVALHFLCACLCVCPFCAYYIQLNEPGELSQWLCHNDSTINIGTGIININIIIINIFHITIINTGFSLKSPTYPRNLSGLPTSSFIIITIHCKQSKHRYFNSAPKKLNWSTLTKLLNMCFTMNSIKISASFMP